MTRPVLLRTFCQQQRQMDVALHQLGPHVGDAAADSTAAVEPWQPPADVRVDGADLLLSLDLPGVSEEQICLRLTDGILEVSGSRAETVTAPCYQRQECPRGAFCRRFIVPADFDSSRLQAHCDRGVLHIVLTGLAQSPAPTELPR